MSTTKNLSTINPNLKVSKLFVLCFVDNLKDSISGKDVSVPSFQFEYINKEMTEGRRRRYEQKKEEKKGMIRKQQHSNKEAT